MKRTNNIFLFILGSLIILLGIFSFLHSQNPATRNINIDQIESKLRSEADTHFDTLESATSSRRWFYSQNLLSEKWYYIEQKDSHPAFWSSNKVGLSLELLKEKRFPHIYIFGDDVHLVFRRNNSFLLKRLINDRVLDPTFISEFQFLRSYEFETITPVEQQLLAGTLSFVRTQNSLNEILIILFFLILIVGVFCVWRSTKNHLQSASLFALTLAIFTWASITFYGFDSIKSSYSWNGEGWPKINSLYTLSLCLIAFVTIGQVLIQFLKRVGITGQLLWTTGLFFTTDLVYGLGKDIVINSEIPFDFEQIVQLTIPTFVSLTLLATMLVILWHWAQIYLLIYSFSTKTLLILGLSLAIFLTFQIFDGHRNYFDLLKPASWLLLLFLLQFMLTKKDYKGVIIWLYLGLSCSILIFPNEDYRKTKYIQAWAQALVDDNNDGVISDLIKIEHSLASLFMDSTPKHQQTKEIDIKELAIEKLYVGQNMENYQLLLFNFDKNKLAINGTVLTYDELNNLYNFHSSPTASSYFYRLTNPKSLFSYIAKFENCTIDSTTFTTFVVLQPSLLQSEFRYPAFYANQKETNNYNLQLLNYALYHDSSLIRQKGEFGYPLELNEKTVVLFKKYSVGYRHFLNYHINGLASVTSTEQNQLRGFISLLSFSLIFIALCWGLLTYFEQVLVQRNFKFTLPQNKLTTGFSYKIRQGLFAILSISLMLSVYIVFSVSKAGYLKNQKQKLQSTLSDISSQFILNGGLNLADTLELQLAVKKLSKAYRVDLNLYDTNGKLKASSNPGIYENKILHPVINRRALWFLGQMQSSKILLDEEIEGTFYLSAYQTILDKNNRVQAFINLPFFPTSTEINKQLSSVLINFINSFLLLLILGIWISYLLANYISKPIASLGQKMADIDIGSTNELLSYQGNDEIGELVSQYNKMVIALENNVKKLAQTEREDAWREMAKQVAHEIKNPLTPMKLSVQHLQRAYLQGPSEKLDILFKKTAELLINQIDALTKMASAFSDFAKLPEAEVTQLKINDTLQSAVSLFSQAENINIEINMGEDLWTRADNDQLLRVFTNIITNAIQAMDKERTGKIQVTLTNEGKYAKIAIQDNGSGIPNEFKNKIFIPNFSTKSSGMGLGLAMCKKIIETIQGSITFETTEGIGTTFIIKLPLCEPKF